ncbi:MAG: DUF3375 domain-containing protein [Myxococcales bacterium]|nr:DUF3375 domain-containing protein [Myxococcales bacterium]
MPAPGAPRLDHDTLELLRQQHPAWRLLRAEHAPFAVSFLYRTFVTPNVRTVSQPELVSCLDDHIYDLRATLGPDAYPRRALEYLDAWAGDGGGWLRKYYPPQADEAHYDLTPAAERAIDFLLSLQQPAFVATESRLLTVFELLRQIAAGVEVDRTLRIAELERRRDELDSQIRRVKAGDIDIMDDTQVRDRFLQLTETARGLLGDFRQVEENFRALDRGVRERIALWEGGKGKLLDEVFGDRDAISDSDQGRSFRAFWDFLMSPARQEELSALLERVMALPAVRTLAPDPRLVRVHYDWLEAGEVAQRTIARLSEQLRRFLDDQSFVENRRILQIIRQIEQHALAVRAAPPEGVLVEVDDTAPTVELPMDRPLFAPPFKATLASDGIREADVHVGADALFEQSFVDRARLAAIVRRALQTQTQISLADLIADNPLSEGLAELVAYLGLASEGGDNVIDDDVHQTIVWTDATGICRQATVPLVVFQRGVT